MAEQPPAAGSDERRWYLVYTKPRQEEVAERNLLRQQYHIYLPRVMQVRRRRGRRVSRVEPLFPRYLFIDLDTRNDNWAPIRSTYGVSNLVRFAGQPAVVPRELVTGLQRRDDTQGIQRVPVEEFTPGGRVRIVEGPLMGYEGIYEAKSSRDRVTILLDIVGRRSRLSLDPVRLERA